MQRLLPLVPGVDGHRVNKSMPLCRPVHDTYHICPCRLLTTDLSILSLRLIRMKAALGTQDSLLSILQAQPALLLQDVELDEVGPLG